MKMIYQETSTHSGEHLVEYIDSHGNRILHQDHNGIWHDSTNNGQESSDREFQRSLSFKRNPAGTPGQ